MNDKVKSFFIGFFTGVGMFFSSLFLFLLGYDRRRIDSEIGGELSDAENSVGKLKESIGESEGTVEKLNGSIGESISDCDRLTESIEDSGRIIEELKKRKSQK